MKLVLTSSTSKDHNCNNDENELRKVKNDRKCNIFPIVVITKIKHVHEHDISIALM